jgi:hypothetical protein
LKNYAEEETVVESVSSKKFNLRGFVSLMVAFSCLGLPFTGIANHWHQMESLMGTRHAWMAAHNVLGLVFVIFVTWHVVLNRRVLWLYVRGISLGMSFFSREAACAAIALASLLFLAVGHTFHVQ